MRYSSIESRAARARLATLAAALGAASITAALAAPPAGATVRQISLLPGMNAGSSTYYGTGCLTTVKAHVTDDWSPVTFYDNGIPIGTVRPSGESAFLQWIPATTGQHTIQAVQVPDDDGAAITVRVGTGMHVGFGCNVFGG